MKCPHCNRLTENDRDRIVRAFEHAAEMELRSIQNLYSWKDTPFMHLRPHLYQDGDAWCALYGDKTGENIQTGLCAFGDSPDKAIHAFNAAYYASAKKSGVASN